MQLSFNAHTNVNKLQSIKFGRDASDTMKIA